MLIYSIRFFSWIFPFLILAFIEKDLLVKVLIIKLFQGIHFKNHFLHLIKQLNKIACLKFFSHLWEANKIPSQ